MLKCKLSRIRIWVWLPILACIVLGAASSSARLDVADFFRKAQIFVSGGQYLEAMGLYQTIADTAAHPDQKARAMLMMGATYGRYLNQPDMALSYFNYIGRHFSNSPAAPEALFKKGMVLYQSRRYREACQAFHDYRDRFPGAKRQQSVQVWAESALNLAVGQKAAPNQPSDQWQYAPDATIRVLLAERQRQLQVKSSGQLVVFDPAQADQAVTFPPGKVTLAARGGRLYINGQYYPGGQCQIKARNARVMFQGCRYRGQLRITAHDQGLTAVNHLPLEQYLYGVVPREVPAKWPAQALMAQAVAARTYAHYICRQSQEKPFDVRATVASQVYGGFDAEQPATTAAVDATRAQVMLHSGGPIVAYFHANSGGYTESPEHVWGAAVPYLQAQPDRYSRNAPGSVWQYHLSYEEAERRLQAFGLAVSHITDLSFGRKNRSGRFEKVVIRSDQGRTAMKSNNFRLAIGSTKLKSTCFQVRRKGDGLLFQGNGYGHGVGMSQWGARQMALGGHSYKGILQHYYAQVSIEGPQDGLSLARGKETDNPYPLRKHQ